MKLADANVLLFAANQTSDEHEAAWTWLEAAFESLEAWALPG